MSSDISRRSLTGSSGAVVTVLGDAVIKRGDQRVGQQGQMMRDFAHLRVFPTVSVVGDTYYVMQRLEEDPGTSLFETTASKLHDTNDLLRDSLWPSTRTRLLVKFDMVAHVEKINTLLRMTNADVDVKRVLGSAVCDIRWDKLKAVKTHGDPTADNLMYDSRGRSVLTDPIPATPAVPDLMCVDIGKMMQSALGYEGLRYGQEATSDGSTYLGLQFGLDDNERLAARYWAAIHLLRAIPYMPTERTRDDIAGLFSYAVGRIRS